MPHPNYRIIKPRDQDTARRTSQNDGRYQGRNDHRQRVDHGSCFALPFLQAIAITMPLQFGEDPENTLSLQLHENTLSLQLHENTLSLQLHENTH